MKTISTPIIFFVAVGVVLISCASTGHLQSEVQLKRQCFEQTPGGCRPIKGIVLGLEIPYQFEQLNFKNDTLSGTIMLIDEFNQDNGRIEKRPSKPLRIYHLDTTTCKHIYIASSDNAGKFSVKVSATNVIAFSNINIDSCCSYLNCIIIDRQNKN